MSDRVLSSQAAKDAIQKIQSIITGGLTEQSNALNNEGQQLSDPNNWDGPLASTFRHETWPHTHQSLQKASQDLTELNKQLQKIATDIFQAGGGA